MAKQAKGSHAPNRVSLSYQLLRNTTSPDENDTGVRSFVVNLPAFEILKLDTKDNLRSYLAEYNPKKRNRVHDAIRRTIEAEPSRFITRNSGFVIACSEIEVQDDKKLVKLTDPSVINGAQSQGEIRRWVEDTYGDEDLDEYEAPFHVRAEIVVDPDSSEVVETAIARNTATPVKSISQAGARGQLDELEASVQKVLPQVKIRKKETDEDVYDTRKLLQITRLLMPASISGNETAAERLRPYKNPEQCLSDFSEWFERREEDEDAARQYEFTVQIAPYAIQEYEYWEKHDAWNGHNLWEVTKKGGRACKREDGKVVWVSPGLLFPLIGAMTEFVERRNGRWMIVKPKMFKPVEMVKRTVQQFRSANSDPMYMGRNPGIYDALRIYPATLMQVLRADEVGGK